MTLLTTPIFYFHQVISALTTPLTTPTPTPSLVKTSLNNVESMESFLRVSAPEQLCQLCLLSKRNRS